MTQCVTAENELEDYLPTYENQAVQFAPEDMGSDKAMGGVLLYILTGVIAFIFAITITNTITKEASVIGTLRASGYSKGELVRHYLSMPVTEFNQMFAQVLKAFSGFLLNKEITDLDADNIATIITERDFTQIADQLDHSMGATITYFQYLCILLSAALIYLLTKIIIEKNEKLSSKEDIQSSGHAL